MLITRLQVPRVVKLKLGSSDIETVDRIKYLGVIIDTSYRCSAHIETVCNRADKLIGALRGILPNINGSPSLARRLYYNVWESIVTYRAPVWARAANTDKDRKKLKRAQRTALCITTTAYRIVSHAALCVLTGNLPIYIKIKMLGETYERTKIHKTRIGADDGSELKEELEAIRKKAQEEWQKEWNNYKKENVTRKLILNALLFTKKKMDIDHHTMQLLTGHGIFGVYRKRIGKNSDSNCVDCGDPNDDAEHALFACPKWTDRRIELEYALGEKIDVDNLIATVTAKNESCDKFRQFCKTVMSHRRVTEKALEEARRRTRATTTTRSSEGRDTRQQRTTEGDQPSILNWL